jgi:hypothetical protein
MTKPSVETKIEKDRITGEEVRFIKGLIAAEKESWCFMRGFRKPTSEEQDENARANELIRKVDLIPSLSTQQAQMREKIKNLPVFLSDTRMSSEGEGEYVQTVELSDVLNILGEK